MAKSNPQNRWTDQYKQLPNQSNFHETVRKIFCTDKWLSSFRCYQEVPVMELIPEYHSNQHRFDWYIKELNIVLELHGEQHYKPTVFGATSYENKMRSFAEGQMRDQLKRDAAIEAGFKYIAIPYKELPKLDGDYLKSLLLKRTP